MQTKYKMQTADCRLQIGFKMQTKYKMQTADCRLGLKCRLRLQLSHRLIRDTFSIYDLGLIILRDPIGLVILLDLFHSTKIIVTIENLYLFINLNHKHLVICYTLQGTRMKAF